MRRLFGVGVLHPGAAPHTHVGRIALTDAPGARDPAMAEDVEGRVIFLGRFGFALLRMGARRSQ